MDTRLNPNFAAVCRPLSFMERLWAFMAFLAFVAIGPDRSIPRLTQAPGLKGRHRNKPCNHGYAKRKHCYVCNG